MGGHCACFCWASTTGVDVLSHSPADAARWGDPDFGSQRRNQLPPAVTTGLYISGLHSSRQLLTLGVVRSIFPQG